ncbi:MAG: hypothetical protein QM689_12250 [Oscillospiraceae bacterium]
MKQQFRAVERYDYTDSLEITGTQDLIDWLKSTMFLNSVSGEKIDRLYRHFEAIREKDGAIRIPKECGLFVSSK